MNRKAIYLFTFISCAMLITPVSAQDNTDAKQDAFDKKFRFGIKINPQFSWAKSSDKSASGAGSSLAFGFGLMTEFRLSKIIGILTGIGGEFEKYKLSYRADNSMSSILVMDKEDAYVEAKDGLKPDQFNLMDGRFQFSLKSRTIKTTFINIPLQFKMNTQEYSGIRYFGLFGVDLGIRTKIVSNEEYAWGIKATQSGSIITTNTLSSGSDLSRENINLKSDASLLPVRLGLNVGGGMEYRIASSTALYFSLNYFMGFNNLMKKESKYLYKGHENPYDPVSGTYNFAPVKQTIIPYAFKVNVGIFF